jgi:pimeloyl-ACP methyl ester carboxylesterase
VAIDLPGHGDSHGELARLDEVTGLIHRLLGGLGVPPPIMVGHSMSAMLAFSYASAFPVGGLVLVDQGLEAVPFADLLHRLEPTLRGPGFAQAWRSFEDSIGLDRVPEPIRSQTLATRRVDQDLVLGYWDEVLSTTPADLQATIDARIPEVDMPCLAVFGRPLSAGERERFDEMPGAQVEVWPEGGHCVHLTDPGRFATRLLAFVKECDGPAG